MRRTTVRMMVTAVVAGLVLGLAAPVLPAYAGPRGGSDGLAAAAVLPTPPPTTRVGGSSRYETSVAISSSFSAAVPVAFIASGLDFPDALSGAVVAARAGGPLLLTRPTDLPDAIARELERLKPQRIVVLGGAGAVSDAVVESLGAFTAGDVTRAAGEDRYGTSVEVSALGFPGGAAVAFVASGVDFPDALSSAAAAGTWGGPVLLTRPDELPAETADELARLAPQRVYVVGGEGAVSSSIAAAVATATGRAPERLAGTDRYATAAAVAQLFAPGVRALHLASGADFPDALSGAVTAARAASPLLLTKPDGLPGAAGAAMHRLAARAAVVLGGTGAVSAEVEALVRDFGTARAAATGDTLGAGTEITAGSCLSAAAGATKLCVTTGGAIEVRSGTVVVWSSATSSTAPAFLRLRADGDLVLFGATGGVIWRASTTGSSSVRLLVAEWGDVFLSTASGGVTWATMTGVASPVWGLPFEAGERWSAGGPHSGSGTNKTRSALDFGPYRDAGTRVVTIAAGTVFEISCGGGRSYLGVKHGGGWESGYYHLVNEQRSLIGTYVAAGTYLGDAGQALPCGGGSNFPHVHLTIRYNGTPTSVEGMTFGGFTVRSSGTDFSGTYADRAGRIVLAPVGGARCCLQAPGSTP